MKNNNLIIVVLFAMFLIAVLFFFKNSSDINVYCNPESEIPPYECEPTAIPNYENLLDAVLYYKIDDDCNFQTLRYQFCENLSFTILGRFYSEPISKNKFQINKLETKLVLKNKKNDKPLKISKVYYFDDNDDENIAFVIEVTDSITSSEHGKSNNIDYIYGNNPNEHPVKLDKDAKMEFYLIDKTKDSILNTYKCNGLGLLAELRSFAGGGYECNGLVTVK